MTSFLNRRINWIVKNQWNGNCSFEVIWVLFDKRFGSILSWFLLTCSSWRGFLIQRLVVVEHFLVVFHFYLVFFERLHRNRIVLETFLHLAWRRRLLRIIYRASRLPSAVNFFNFDFWRLAIFLWFLFISVCLLLIWGRCSSLRFITLTVLNCLVPFLVFLLLGFACYWLFFFFGVWCVALVEIWRLNTLHASVNLFIGFLLALEFLEAKRDELDEDPGIHCSVVLLSVPKWTILPVAHLFSFA